MDPASTLSFARAARALSARAAGLGLAVPGFRCPPRIAGVDRSLRRRPDGTVTVAVRVRGRREAAVLADMVDGILAANALSGSAASEARSQLWESVADAPSTVHHRARVA